MKVKTLIIIALIAFALVAILFVFKSSLFISPEVKYGEFPCKLTYEINGEIKTIEDVIICEYDGIEIDEAHGTKRKWKTSLKSGNERIILLDLRDSGETGIHGYPILELFFHQGNAGYYMGDPNYKSFPKIKNVVEYKYLKEDGNYGVSTFDSEEAYERFGIRLIRWECASPISNEF